MPPMAPDEIRWRPPPHHLKETRVARLMRQVGVKTAAELHAWSVRDVAHFWDVALQAILQAQGLAATEDASGIITIDSYKNLASNQALEPMVTQIVDVNYAKATTLRQTVQALLARDCTGLSTLATGRDFARG